ncbi:low molecular weight phosphatase family protein [Arthrobacter antioxidans]|uniref:arsenate reductase/protein-tyrosine-phosphatase family protein n=1 Tax=Arthrobacter antioxidans TaxID=2895818 RepID=UPI0020003218|nr:low molecular weight phosphatase family protein [Arthrobacter antioxidans]
MTTDTPFRILAVCTGNICRSPMTERLLQAGLDERYPGQFVVESAGTGALAGNPIDPQIAGLVRRFGGTADNFSARQLTPEILREVDLVLALTRAHRSRVVETVPAMLRKTFTLREFARILPHLTLDEALPPADRWRAALPRALRARASHTAPELDDVVDPYRRSDEVYRQMVAQIIPPLRTLALPSAGQPGPQADVIPTLAAGGTHQKAP